MISLNRRAFLQTLGAVGAGAAFTRLLHSPLAAMAQGVDHVYLTYEAVVDTLFPATPHLARHITGGVQMKAHEFVIDAFDSFLAAVPTRYEAVRLSAVVAAAIDAHAAQITPGKTFVEQSFDERVRTLAAIDVSPNGDTRFIGFALGGMAALGFYTEWPAYGKRYAGDHHLDLTRLPVWGEIGFTGPEDGFAKLLYPYHPGFPLDPTDPNIP